MSRLAVNAEVQAGNLQVLPIRGLDLSRELRAVRDAGRPLPAGSQTSAFWHLAGPAGYVRMIRPLAGLVSDSTGARSGSSVRMRSPNVNPASSARRTGQVAATRSRRLI